MVDEKERAQCISETMTDGLLELDLHGKILYANPAALSMLGFTFQEITKKTHRDLTPAKWHQQESQVIQETNLAQHQEVALEQEYLRQNNSTFPVWLKPILLTGPDQKPAKILILFQDLTRQKEQEQLQQTHQRQLNSLSLITRKLQENDTVDQTVHFVLEAMAAAMKYPEVAVPLIAIEDETFSTNKYSDELDYGLTASIFVNGREAGEVTIYYSENKPFTLPDEQHILETVAQALGVWLAQKSAAQELADIEEQSRSIFDNMESGFALYEVKDEGRELIVLDWNRAAEKMYNLLRHDVLGQDIKKFFPVMEKTDIYKAIVECSRSGESKTIPLVHYQDAHHDQYMQNIIYRVGDKVAVIFRDVTEEEKARQELMSSEQKFRSLFEGSAEAVYLHTLDPVNPQFVDINQNACQMLHYTRAELLALGPAKIDSPEYAALVPERVAKILKEGQALFESEHMTKEGKPVPVEISVGVVEVGGQKYMLSFVRDISERKQLEKVLRESEERFRNLSEVAPTGIFFLNMRGEVIYVNKKLISLSGMSFDECLGNGWRKLIHPEEQEQVLKLIADTLPQGKEFSLKFRIVNKRNETRWVHSRIKIMFSAKNQPAGFIGIAEDITDLEKAKTELTNQLAFIQQLLEAIPNPVSYKDNKGIYLGCNQAFERFLGQSKEMIVGKSVYELSPKDLADVYHQQDQELLDHPGSQVYESSIQQANGTRRIVIFNKATYNNPDGTVAGLIGVITDITERQKQEQKYKAIIQTSIDGFWLADLQGNIIEVNDSYCKMIGYNRAELLKMKISDVEVSEKPEDVQAHIRRIKESGGDYFETRHKCKEGKIIDIMISVTYLRDADQMFIFARDITESKQAEAALLESDELLSEMTTQVPGVVFQFYVRPNGQMGMYYVSSGSEQIIGLKPDLEGYFERFAALVIPEYRDGFIRSIEKSVKESREWKYEGILQKPTGENIWFLGNSVPSKRENEMIFNGIAQDITERKRTEIILRKQRQELSTILDSSPAMIFYKDKENNFVRVNQAMAKGSALTKEEMEGKSAFNLYPREIAEHYWQDDKEVMNSDSPKLNIIEPLDTPKGLKWVQTDKVPYKNEKGEVIGIIGFALDITERKKAEENINNSQKLLQRIINLLPVRVFWKDKDLKYLGCNEIFAKDAGKNGPEDLIGKDDFQMNWKEQAKIYRDDDQSVIKSGKSKLNFEEPQTTPTGEIIWLETSKVPLTDLQENIIGILGTYEDITERKRIEEELKKRLNELDRFNKVTLEREKRIIELKKKVKELEQGSHGQK